MKVSEGVARRESSEGKIQEDDSISKTLMEEF
jgi:hypothetical protein